MIAGRLGGVSGSAGKTREPTRINAHQPPKDAQQSTDGTGRDGCLAGAGLLLPQRFSRCCPQPGYRSGHDQG
jgi:hypothetical protein